MTDEEWANKWFGRLTKHQRQVIVGKLADVRDATACELERLKKEAADLREKHTRDLLGIQESLAPISDAKDSWSAADIANEVSRYVAENDRLRERVLACEDALRTARQALSVAAANSEDEPL